MAENNLYWCPVCKHRFSVHDYMTAGGTCRKCNVMLEKYTVLSQDPPGPVPKEKDEDVETVKAFLDKKENTPPVETNKKIRIETNPDAKNHIVVAEVLLPSQNEMDTTVVNQFVSSLPENISMEYYGHGAKRYMLLRGGKADIKYVAAKIAVLYPAASVNILNYDPVAEMKKLFFNDKSMLFVVLLNVAVIFLQECGLESALLADAHEHVGVWLAQGDVGPPTGGMLDALADTAAIDENRRLVGGADTVGVRGQVRQPLAHPPAGTAQTGVGERHVKSGNDGIRAVVGRVGSRDEAGLLKLADHAGRAEQEEAACLGIMGMQIVNHGHRGVVDLLSRGLNAHLMQLEQIVGDGARRVVGQERIGDAQLGELMQEIQRIGKQCVAQIDGSVHVQRHVANLFQFFVHSSQFIVYHSSS